MTNEQKKEAVCQKIIEAIKYSDYGCCAPGGGGGCCGGSCTRIKAEIIGRTIRLSNVLNTTKIYGWPKAINGEMRNNIFLDVVYSWNLNQDDLNLQSPETWDLLYNLLCK